jgi:hypothetical protein
MLQGEGVMSVMTRFGMNVLDVARLNPGMYAMYVLHDE